MRGVRTSRAVARGNPGDPHDLSWSWFDWQQRGVTLEALDRSNLTTTAISSMTWPNLPSEVNTSAALTMGDGENAVANYAMAYGDLVGASGPVRGVTFATGDGRTLNFWRTA